LIFPRVHQRANQVGESAIEPNRTQSNPVEPKKEFLAPFDTVTPVKKLPVHASLRKAS
jgi:hypothetical protein